MEDTFPDVGSMSDEELKELIDALTDEEREVSYRRRLLHGKIDILRAELVNRLKAKREGGDALITRRRRPALTDILLGKVAGPPRRDVAGRSRRWRVHCPECGFVNAEGANYCQKCGAYLGAPGGRRRLAPR